ncbi:hypothetical protein H8E07_20805 [bacterium]|nr:hypothetical protein [bacterium]
MKRIIVAITAVLALSLLAGSALAAFENLDISPRARGMGDTAVAVADDAFAPYFNPAGLARIQGVNLGTSYLRPYDLSFAEHMYLGGVIPGSPRLGNFGFGIRYFAVEYQEVFLDKEVTYTLAHGIMLYEDLHSSVSFGSALNFYSLEFGNTVSGFDPGAAFATGVDVGLLATLHRRTRIGVLVKNLNNPQIGLDNEELTSRLHGGIAYMPYDGVTTAFEFENTIDGETQYHGGVEFSLMGDFRLRGGVMTNPGKYTGGFGYAFEGLMVNYGFSSGGGVLSPSHQFGLTFAWGGETP